jgi:hypothetical protein
MMRSKEEGKVKERGIERCRKELTLVVTSKETWGKEEATRYTVYCRYKWRRDRIDRKGVGTGQMERRRDRIDERSK